MEWLVLLVVPIYYVIVYFVNRMAAKNNAEAAVPEITEQWWHDDWNKSFIALGGEEVLTEDQAKAVDAAPKVLSTTTPSRGVSREHNPRWKEQDLIDIITGNWQGETIRSTRPLRCDLCGLPHRTEICDEYDLWEDDEDE
jgi:hypothetical protein